MLSSSKLHAPKAFTVTPSALCWLHDPKLWCDDGTRSTLVQVPSRVGSLAAVGAAVLFGASDPDHGDELWQCDATGANAALLLDLDPGQASSEPYGFIAFREALLFAAHVDELWRSDGTAGGTVAIADLAPGPPAWTNMIGELTATSDAVYFVASDLVHGRELWRTDGTTAGTHMIADLNPTGDSAPHVLGAALGLLFFSADDGVVGRSLWRTDGTAAGTVRLRPGLIPTAPYGEAPHRGSIAVGGVLHSGADDGVHGDELWQTDGTPEGTALVADILPGPESSAPRDLTMFEGRIVFTATGYPKASDFPGVPPTWTRRLWALMP